MSEDRYHHIMQQLAQRKRQAAQQTALSPLADIVNGLDVQTAVERAIRQVPAGFYASGPKTIKTRRASPAAIGVVMWMKAGGFYGYRTLIVAGVWAQAADTVTQIIIGRKTLMYSAATYNPESYHKLIRKGYSAYYTDDNTPPADGVQFDYVAEQRLALRKRLAAELLLQITSPT
ncbi:MAG: hypothetical protein AAF787_02105 [Chloroflexota bacterium]